MQNNRKQISAGELYVMLDREFRTRQSRECKSCYILLPFRIDQPDHSKPNWEIVPPAECMYNCAALIEEIVEAYAKVYDLAPDNGDD
jgi:hypothetical protein